MEFNKEQGSKFSSLSKGLMLAFAASFLVSVYLLFTLPSDLKFAGNIQYMDLVSPILTKLQIALALTAVLAFVALYAEMKNIKVAIVYKEKSAVQSEEKKIRTESDEAKALDSKTITSKDTNSILSDSLNAISKTFNAVAGACYGTKEEASIKFVELVSGYALPESETGLPRYNFGEGIIGQVAKSGSAIYLDEIPEGYIQAGSGLGQATPRFIAILPMKKNKEVKVVLEIATFKAISTPEKLMLEKFVEEIGERLAP